MKGKVKKEIRRGRSKQRAGRPVVARQQAKREGRAGPGLRLYTREPTPQPVGGRTFFFSPTSEEEEEEADRVGESEGEDDGGAPASGEEILRPCAREISGTCPLLPPTPLPLPLPL